MSDELKTPGGLRVAAIQMRPTTGDPVANVARADRPVREAVLEHTTGLVILPECALTGYASPATARATVCTGAAARFSETASDRRRDGM